MFNNPFTPVFGGKPESFFGREAILARFDAALVDRGSEYRALFVTGSRGYGKTALLEQLSSRAKKAGWLTIDVGPENPIASIMRNLDRYDEATQTIEPEVELNVFGSGGKLSGGSLPRTAHYSRDDFEFVFLRACERRKERLFVSVDEAQKVTLDDMSAISNVFQMASRKGHDVVLAIAGLPYAYEKIIQHEGCTFMRRGAHESLGPFTRREVEAGFRELLGGVRGLSVTDGAMDELVSFSKGHPYVMQLEGHYLIESINGKNAGRHYEAGLDDVKSIEPLAIEAYRHRALDPLLADLPDAQVGFLRAMAQSLDADRVASTGDIAAKLGKKPNEASRMRKQLLDNGLVYAPSRGQLIFAIPYLADYLLENRAAAGDGLAVALEWRF